MAVVAQDLDRRVAFDAPVEESDGHGGVIMGWTDDSVAIKVWANFRFLRGGEVVQAARLEGRQPIVVTVRSGAHVGAIDTSWRMRDKDDQIYNIRSGPTRGENRNFLEFTVESGVAV